MASSHGTVEINGKLIPVKYRYIDFHTIECTSEDGEEFLTSYKSLVVNVSITK